MIKKLLYSFISLAMLIGMFGVMGQGAVQSAQAQDKIIGTATDLESAAALVPLSSIDSVKGDLTGYTRNTTDPTDCDAGLQTSWWRFTFSAPPGEAAPRYASVMLYPEFDAVMVFARSTGPLDGDHVVIDCMQVQKDTLGMLTVPITAGQEYKLMLAVKQGYPYAGEPLEVAVTPHRNPDPVVVKNAAPSNVAPRWATPEGLTDFNDSTIPLIRPGYSTAIPFDGVGGSPDWSFFDFDDCAGPVNHMTWTESIGGINYVLFDTVTRPAAVLLDPVNDATTRVQTATDGGVYGYNLRLVPSDWQTADVELPISYALGADVAGCQGVAPDGVCFFRTQPGTYDALLYNPLGILPPVGTTFFNLAITDKLMTSTVLPIETLDFRATSLPQATIEMDLADAVVGTSIVVRSSDALGDYNYLLQDGDRMVVNANAAKMIEIRINQNNWLYALDPVFTDKDKAVSETFAAGDEVIIKLDSGSRNNLGIPILPYRFNATIDISEDLTQVTTTDFVDAVGNTLIAVAAPDDTLLPGDANPRCAVTQRDEIVPNTWVAYGFGLDVLASEFTWDNTPITITAPEIGRYFAQRSLLTGPNVRAGGPAFANPYGPFSSGAVWSAEDQEALSPTDVGETHWSWSWVMAMYEAGLTTGLEPGVYGPDVVMQRSEMAVFLSRLLQAYGVVPAGTAAAFDDVDATYWAVAEIEHLREEGITDGCGDNNFCPNDEVTRAEMAKFLELTFRIIEVNNPGSFPHWDQNQNVFNPGMTFVDVPMDHWANIWIEELFWDGLTLGCRRDQINLWFCPEDSVTRGQMAKFIMSAHQTDAVTQAFWPVLAPEK